MRKTLIGIAAGAVAAVAAYSAIHDEEVPAPVEPTAVEITDAMRAEAVSALGALIVESNQNAIEDHQERLTQPFGDNRIVQQTNDDNAILPVFEIYGGDAELKLARVPTESSSLIQSLLEEVRESNPKNLHATGPELKDLLLRQSYSLSRNFSIGFPDVVQKSGLIAIYNTESQRICMAPVDGFSDCFPKEDLAPDAPLAVDIRTIEQVVTAATPAGP